jgi:hypothetical protein
MCVLISDLICEANKVGEGENCLEKQGNDGCESGDYEMRLDGQDPFNNDHQTR